MFSDRTFIIAEAGVNHNGDRARALELVRVAASSGADAVKFQSFKADRLVTVNARKAPYQERTTGAQQSQFDMLRSLELSEEMEVEIAAECVRRGIMFMSTPFDEASADFLVQKIGMGIVKIGSGDLTNLPLLLHVGRFRKPTILSTGMATLDEIERALGAVAFGMLRGKSEMPSRDAFAEAWSDARNSGALIDRVALLHCTTEYPAPVSSLNLSAMNTLRDAFGLCIGFSDHSEGVHYTSVAVAMGAKIIEKHFTLDASLPGPDHKASIEPDELVAMVKSIRETEVALGVAAKAPDNVELKNRDIARRSLVAAQAIKRGEAFSPANLTVKRPGSGVPPEFYWDYLEKAADRDYAKDEIIERQ